MTASNFSKKDFSSFISQFIRSVQQRGVEDLNADYAWMMSHKEAYIKVIELLLEQIQENQFDFVVGIEATGLPIAGALAYQLGVGLIMMRKYGKLPGEVIASKEFFLPYKKERHKLEIQADLDLKGKSILLFDESLDSGITLKTAIDLLLKAQVGDVVVLTITNYPELREIRGKEVRSLCYGQY